MGVLFGTLGLTGTGLKSSSKEQKAPLMVLTIQQSERKLRGSIRLLDEVG